jgi:hypothetical protein
MANHKDTIIVSNYKSIDQMKTEGGCGYWAIGDDVTTLKKRNVRYVLCAFNRSLAEENCQPLTHNRGEPYFIATLTELPTLHRPGYVDDSGKRHLGRQLLKLEKYAEIPSGSFEPRTLREGHTYGNLKEMGIELDQLEMRDFDSKPRSHDPDRP